MRCAGCNRELQVGDRYIADTSSGFNNLAADPAVDGLMADILGGVGNRILICEDCTEAGGHYMLETVYGDEDDGFGLERTG